MAGMGLLQSLEGAGLALVIYGFLFWMGGMGAGDVKLCIAIGAWIGPSQLFLALVITGMVGGVMALCWAAFGGFLKELFTGASNLVFSWKGKRRRSRSRDGVEQSQAAEDALRAGHCDRNVDFIFCALRRKGKRPCQHCGRIIDLRSTRKKSCARPQMVNQ